MSSNMEALDCEKERMFSTKCLLVYVLHSSKEEVKLNLVFSLLFDIGDLIWSLILCEPSQWYSLTYFDQSTSPTNRVGFTWFCKVDEKLLFALKNHLLV